MSAKPEHSTSLAELRRRIADLEGRLPFETQSAPAPASAAIPQGPDTFCARTGASNDPVGRCPLGLGVLERLFRSAEEDETGLRLGALHEVVSSQSRDAGALSGFALALLAQVLDQRPGPVLIVQDPGTAREAGQFHGPGLLAFGIDPGRLVVVRPRRLEELLWSLEEGATCPALSAVVAEIQGPQRLMDLTSSRRIALRAERSRVPVFLLRHGTAFEPTAALTRWQITPAASRPPDFLENGPHPALGRPVWTVELTRNRDGRPGRLTVEWDHARRTFAAPAHALALDRGSTLRPDPTPAGSTVVSLPPAG